ncbi:MAG: hypothetical protein J5841_07790 [Clostridia bacterium]|nr:hypothetical protein [Clostridia bacterium]
MSVPQIMLIVLALAFAIWYLVTALAPQKPASAQIQAGVIGTRYTGDCLIVREEIPYPEDTVSSVRYVAEEGSYVTRGDKICNVYSTGYSTKEQKTLQDYRDQIKEYQTDLLKKQVNTDAYMEKLEADVLTRAREVRELIGGARGNMYNQETALAEAIRKRQNRLRELYVKDQRLSRYYDDEQSQLQRISSWTKQCEAKGDGLVSFYSDGYEYGLTMNNYSEFSPAEVRSMINGSKPAETMNIKGKTTVYRLIKDGHWVVLMLIKDNNWNPVEGAEYELKLENFKDTMVRATVLSFTRTGGELEVQLDVQSDVQPVLYIRTCTGVLGDNVMSLTVPPQAIWTQDNMPGVVVLDGDYPFFIPVNVVDKRDGLVYISPIQPDTIYEGQTVKLFW